MEHCLARDELSGFMESGIYQFENSNFIFVDPVRVLNRSYSRFRVSPSGYYQRFFDFERKGFGNGDCLSSAKKRKRKEKKPHSLNEKERAADQRHQLAKPLLLKAHELLLQATDLLGVMSSLNRDVGSSVGSRWLEFPKDNQSLIEHGQVWQAPLYEITLKRPESDQSIEVGESSFELRVASLFNNLVVNETRDEVEAEFLDHQYILPRESCFYMSDLRQVHNLIPATASCGFSLIVVDPPWENGSAQQKSKYPTLPNRYFLALPIKKLSHRKGALVALWVTNREKFHRFIDVELFPAWGVKHISTYYWLKVKGDGSLIGDLDLFHHRPYECLLLGYCYGEDVEDLKVLEQSVPKDQVIISITGDYSRKPPIGELLQKYVPGPKPGRCIELFAREMNPGWLSWGNEPLHFQESKHFTRI
ncbi:methyltransferase-like protein 2 isoform X2 [Momordica charantia]|uniref:Methyltransferase-like protein 2 isoform X2 n=1 Tax=Momordica charantia TaxID=3673 RepID=A0A6J1CSN8_MOMCH|nr:methyltransferase-like protein 2 isoform X2 [Momordica charantia]